MGFPKAWQDQRSVEVQVGEVAKRTRSFHRVPCAQCGHPAHRYIEDKVAGIASFRCRKCASPTINYLRGCGAELLVVTIREAPLDAVAELRYQGRVNQIVEQNESRRDRAARGEGLLSIEELALLTIAYDRGESAESFANRILGGTFFLATAGAQ